MAQVSLNQLLDEYPLYTTAEISGFLCVNEVKKQKQLRAITSGANANKTKKLSSTFRPRLYCSSEGCGNHTYFEMLTGTDTFINLGNPSINKVVFRCCNCKENQYSFYLEITSSVSENADNTTIFNIQKVGQQPRHGKPAPKKALKLIGKERSLFFKGAISENQGLGIGAFSYYRRVIDSQKNKIFEEVIKVLKLTLGNESLIKELEEAKKETQFTNAVDRIKTALPDSLKINGHNPLTLLYAALSEGLHSHTDEECLGIAQDIKVVLFEFSERLESALKESVELDGAIGRLAKRSR